MSIELKNVTKQFGGVAAVNNVSFNVKEGELMALLGPSGGGKTTVLRMIAGLEMPTTGDVFIRGQRVNDVSVRERNIGFVFQNYALFKNMNVFKNIAFGLKIKKWKRADITARVEELVKLFGKPPGVCYRTLDEIDALIAANPFGPQASDKALKLYVAFMDRVPARLPVLPIHVEKEHVEITAIRAADMLIVSRRKPNGMYGFPNACVEQLGVVATSRNCNTVTRVAAFARK